MKKRVVLIFLFCCSAMLSIQSLATSNSESLDQIIAVVNDDVVTKSELNHALSLVKMQINQTQQPAPPPSILQKQVLDQLINKKLQLQLAKQAGIEVTDADLDNTIQHIAEQNNVSTSALYERLTQEGMSVKDYREEMRDQITLQKLQQQEVVSHITVSADEITAFMRSQSWQQHGAKEYHLEDILIPLSDAPTTEEIAAAKQKAQRVVDKLKQGQPFKEVAQAESGAQHALQGGDLGWRGLAEIPSAFSEQVVNMQAKEIAGPIQTPNGFHVIRLVEVRSTNGKTPDRKQIEDLLMQRKFEEAIQNWVSKLRHQAFINTNTDKAAAKV